jgi:hypothetical protein
MLAERLTAQLLAGPPARDPLEVTDRLLAVQAQDARGARLAIRARTSGLSAADVDRALTEDRSLLITWLNRGTLQLVRSEDYPLLQALTTPQLFTGNARRLGQEGVTPVAVERGVSTLARSLAEDGPLNRNQLRERIAAAGVRTEGQALVHVLMLACLRGIAVRGPMKGNEQAYVLARDWLGEPPAIERDTALGELARRYMRGHAPADDRDLARWAGLPLRDARAGLGSIARELRERSDGLLELARVRRRPFESAPVRLLGTFEPVLLGWCSREAILGSHVERVVRGGVFRPFALSEGRAVAAWGISGRALEVEAFEPLAPEVAHALATEQKAVLRFLGLATE